jgi:hypothetical protein
MRHLAAVLQEDSPEVAAHRCGIDLVYTDLGSVPLLSDERHVIVQRGERQEALAWFGLVAAMCRRHDLDVTEAEQFALSAVLWERARARSGSGTYSRVAG